MARYVCLIPGRGGGDEMGADDWVVGGDVGIWYLEFRTSRHSRKVVATIQGQAKE